jgi:hypothetical protein
VLDVRGSIEVGLARTESITRTPRARSFAAASVTAMVADGLIVFIRGLRVIDTSHPGRLSVRGRMLPPYPEAVR